MDYCLLFQRDPLRIDLYALPSKEEMDVLRGKILRGSCESIEFPPCYFPGDTEYLPVFLTIPHIDLHFLL